MIGFDYMRFDMSEKDNVKKIEEAIQACDSEDTLRHLRDCVDSHLSKVKFRNADARKADCIAKYEGKTILVYGHHMSMLYSIDNPRDIRIIHVLQIHEELSGTFTASTRMLQIEYNSETYISDDNFFSGGGSVSINTSVNDNMYIDIKDIKKVLTKDEIKTFIDNARTLVKSATDNWDNEPKV